MNKNRQYLYENNVIGVTGLTLEALEGNYPNWFLDKEVCAYNAHGWFPKQAQGLENYIKSLDNNPSQLVWAVYHKQDQCHIGNISLSIFNRIDNTAELALLMGEKHYWGKGYAHLAAQFILRHGFEVLNLHRIFCATAETNIGMLKLAKKLGMTQEGIRRESLYLSGEYVDEIEFGVLRNEVAS